MNVSQLRAFITVVELGSFSAAARQMNVSQPAVTMQVQSLESDLGATLLERRYRKVGLTEAGRALLPHAKAVLAEIGEAREALDRLSATVSGRVSLMASTTPGQYVLPRALGAFAATHPAVGVALEIGDTAAVVDAVASGRADLGVTGAEVPGAKVRFEELGSDELIVIAPPGDPLAAGGAVPLGAIAEAPMVMREAGSGTRMIAEGALRRGGLEPAELRVVLEVGSSEAIVNAVEGGMGLGIVSRRIAEKALALGTVADVPAEGFPVSRPFYLVTRTGPASRAAEALADSLRAGV